MVLVWPSAVKTAGIPVDAGYMQLAVKLRKAESEKLIGFFGEKLEGSVQNLLKLSLMLQKPGSFVIKRQFPQKVTGFLSKSFKHNNFLTLSWRFCSILS